MGFWEIVGAVALGLVVGLVVKALLVWGLVVLIAVDKRQRERRMYAQSEREGRGV